MLPRNQYPDMFIMNLMYCQAIDTIRIDAINMNFDRVCKINDSVVKFKNSGKQLLLFEGFKKGKNTLKFHYKAIPKQTLYFTGKEIICKFGHKDKENTRVIGYRVSMMQMKK